MIIKLYIVSDNDHQIPKHLNSEKIVTGTLRSETDFMNPVFRVESDNSTIYNYVYIPDFNRFYYLSPPVSIRSGLLEYSGRVDVLQSYYTQFIHCPMIAARSYSTYNAYLPDSQRKFEQRTMNQYVHIGAFEPIYSAIMATVG